MNDQRSLREQLDTLCLLANVNSLYDAADWLKVHLDGMKKREAERTSLRLTDAQKRLLQSLKDEAGDKGSWTEILPGEIRSAEVLAAKRLIDLRPCQQGFEAQVIEDVPEGSSETRSTPQT